MDWLSQNWVWLVFLGVMVAMHLVGHGRHAAGANGHAGAHDPPAEDETSTQMKPATRRAGH